ncbi:MAG: substrate-binding domain-containing protein [Ruminococcus sp.]|nr:substrate-binding domain-containing protein [Ruminococcus sp.]
MKAVGKIGVIIPEIFDSLDQELIQGIYMQAKELGYDVLIFCDTCNSAAEYSCYPEIIGHRNIYQLPLQAELNGILFYAPRFLDSACRDRIYDSLEKLSVPCLVIGEKTQRFPYITASQTESMFQMTKHLIEEHHCRKIYCLSGFPNEANSMERVQGFYKAMTEASLTADESMIFYGDFWIEKPRQLGMDIASGKIPKPDAVVCASDQMAVALCEALTENGIIVPEDIAVTGYDGCWNSFLSNPKITTICGRDKQLGFMAICRLYEMMTGKACKQPVSQQYIRYGTSCGCSPRLRDSDRNIESYICSTITRSYEQKMFMPSNFISSITESADMQELVNNIYRFSYLLKPVRQYAICLCEDWHFDFENAAVFRKEGFSERMLLALERNAEDAPETNQPFLCKDLVPDLNIPHEPQLKVFTSLHHGSQIFGYIALTYNNAQNICFDEHFMNWCNAAANGFNTLQKILYREHVRQQIEALSVLDHATGFYNKRGLLERLSDFSSGYTQHDQNYLCILIAHVQKNNISEQLGTESELMTANALRLSSGENELLCRLQDNVFAVILPVSDDNTEQLTHKRIMQLEQKIQYMQGSVPQLQMPELIIEASPIQFDKISKADMFIEKMQRSILQKTEAAAIMTGNYKERLHRLRREISASPQKDWNISEASRTIGISTSHFQRIYKSEFGMGFKEDVIEARLEKAKQLLLHTDLRVQEIAYACGYGDCSHFMRQFKEKVGVTALQYRQDGNE